ncbi:hypothetical protein BU26DRAFT_609836 [Trematosphaeria pertusa]|uniref:Uncharacterized protein n=1 Tax=Trematosphaeria pertusa TaxID=390896 RepID=A0A6A6HZH5_9PLEO|nr:uncharacterized protein BU26DRAFT_609836 [Trematosphaeria pertusa]KAF2243168.1 hypothetical protein BU26DRAFT_609836 [Trematosphaeria pertusa]
MATEEKKKRVSRWDLGPEDDPALPSSDMAPTEETKRVSRWDVGPVGGPALPSNDMAPTEETKRVSRWDVGPVQETKRVSRWDVGPVQETKRVSRWDLGPLDSPSVLDPSAKISKPGPQGKSSRSAQSLISKRVSRWDLGPQDQPTKQVPLPATSEIQDGSQRQYSLLDLPGEVRRQIYDFCVPRSAVSLYPTTSSDASREFSGLLQTCKLIRAEFLIHRGDPRD